MAGRPGVSKTCRGSRPASVCGAGTCASAFDGYAAPPFGLLPHLGLAAFHKRDAKEPFGRNSTKPFPLGRYGAAILTSSCVLSFFHSARKSPERRAARRAGRASPSFPGGGGGGRGSSLPDLVRTQPRRSSYPGPKRDRAACPSVGPRILWILQWPRRHGSGR
jgi:hypothetical protein